MKITPIFSIGIGNAYEPGYLDLSRKIFAENKHLLHGNNGNASNFKHQNINKHIIDESYVCPEDIEKLKEIILEHGISYLKQTTAYIDIYEYEVKNLWLNELIQDGRQMMHNHPGFVVSGTYYVDLPANSSPIAFHNPNQLFLPQAYEVELHNEYCSENCVFLPKEGDLFFWFANLYHSVDKTSYSGHRRSISFDISIKGLK